MSRIAALVLLFLAAAPAAALADRSADGRLLVRDARPDVHVTATLSGAGWAQLLGASAGTPAFGRYARTVGDRCREEVDLTATARRTRPRAVGRDVTVSPPAASAEDTLRIAHSGHHGAVTWWSGADLDGDAAAAGVQRAPAALRAGGARWVVYRVRTSSNGLAASCSASARLARTALSAARTMHLASGPPVARAPFDTA